MAIAAQLRISRPSVREAIKTLEAQGLVRVVNGKGIFVEQVDASFHTDTINRNYLIKQLIDVMEVRRALEGLAVEQCTVYASREDLEELSRILGCAEWQYYHGKRNADNDLLFHQRLIAMGNNALAANMLRTLLQNVSGMWSMGKDFSGIFNDSIPAHRVMMDHMLAGEAREAVQTNNAYMDETIRALKALRT